MNLLFLNPVNFKKTLRYIAAPNKGFCVKIIDLCADFIVFEDDSGSLHHIESGWVSFWGRDIYAEILSDYYGGAGLNVNTPCRHEYFEEAKMLITKNDLIRFCNDNKARWTVSINNVQLTMSK